MAAGLNAIAIALGSEHTCAIVAGGKVKCWGNGLDGQLGIGTKEVHWSPVTVQGPRRQAFASMRGGRVLVRLCVCMKVGGAVFKPFARRLPSNSAATPAILSFFESMRVMEGGHYDAGADDSNDLRLHAGGSRGRREELEIKKRWRLRFLL
jgi:hypothetical protein